MLNNRHNFFLKNEDRRNISEISYKSDRLIDNDDIIYKQYRNNMPHTNRDKKESNSSKKQEDNLLFEITIPIK